MSEDWVKQELVAISREVGDLKRSLSRTHLLLWVAWAIIIGNIVRSLA